MKYSILYISLILIATALYGQETESSETSTNKSSLVYSYTAIDKTDSLKYEMKQARENRDMVKFEDLKTQVQLINSSAHTEHYGVFSSQQQEIENLKIEMKAARESRDMVKFEELKEEIQEKNRIPYAEHYGTLSPEQQEIENLKTEMKAARENRDMVKFEELKERIQELNILGER